jgi:CRISPR-associated protein Csm3
MKLKKIHEIKGQVEVLTGLHIGGSKDNIEIGGMDNPIIKDPLNGAPYIPGSSLKGKMRSQLELVFFSEHLKADGGPVGNPKTLVCKIFGMPISRETEEERAVVGPTRIIVRDAVLAPEWQERYKRGELPSEEKYENSIHRLKGVAQNPRPLERVPAGVEFSLSITLKEMEGDILQDHLDLIGKGLQLIEMDGLGGSISRGSGQVEFKQLTCNGEPFEHRKLQVWGGA